MELHSISPADALKNCVYTERDANYCATRIIPIIIIAKSSMLTGWKWPITTRYVCVCICLCLCVCRPVKINEPDRITGAWFVGPSFIFTCILSGRWQKPAIQWMLFVYIFSSEYLYHNLHIIIDWWCVIVDKSATVFFVADFVGTFLSFLPIICIVLLMQSIPKSMSFPYPENGKSSSGHAGRNSLVRTDEPHWINPCNGTSLSSSASEETISPFIQAVVTTCNQAIFQFEKFREAYVSLYYCILL